MGWTPDAETNRDFWSKVKVSEVDACWEWQAGRNASGYGRFKRKGAHRTALSLATGIPLDTDMLALHGCDNPPCCNPNHLRWGTTQDNSRDTVARGRTHKWNGKRAGERNPRAKITAAIAEEIRRRYAPGAYGKKKLCKDFGLAKTTIYLILKGRIWA
ncbi:HNH endonuclease [Sphingomonas montanisoli]|uniref:HNH nuclease domain-containing protein n=1 Tax=Sphingomonas montanisoli TaxID=2606412 RepID=A0A5D9C209_9SPHN|nr:hypothetical protein FYJ91_11425 [Sphingomonas montanisoli]